MKKINVVYIDCGHHYGVLPCRKWEGDTRSDQQLIRQARKDFKYRAKKAKEFGILDYQHKNKDQLQHQINFANIHAQVKKDCDSHKSSPNNQLDIVMDSVNFDNMAQKSIKN